MAKKIDNIEVPNSKRQLRDPSYLFRLAKKVNEIIDALNEDGRKKVVEKKEK